MLSKYVSSIMYNVIYDMASCARYIANAKLVIIMNNTPFRCEREANRLWPCVCNYITA